MKLCYLEVSSDKHHESQELLSGPAVQEPDAIGSDGQSADMDLMVPDALGGGVLEISLTATAG